MASQFKNDQNLRYLCRWRPLCTSRIVRTTIGALSPVNIFSSWQSKRPAQKSRPTCIIKEISKKQVQVEVQLHVLYQIQNKTYTNGSFTTQPLFFCVTSSLKSNWVTSSSNIATNFQMEQIWKGGLMRGKKGIGRWHLFQSRQIAFEIK